MNISTSDRLPNLPIPSSTTQFQQSQKTLEQENAELRRQVAELRSTLRTLAYQVQTAMPALTALVEQRDDLAMAWSKVDRVMKETQ